MVWMLVAEVIEPLRIDKAYVVAPAGPSAVLPVELAQTWAGLGVMVGVAGLALMVTLTVLLAEQPAALVDVRGGPTVPDAPAVEVMVWMVVAEVIEPLTIDQEYVVAPAGPAEEL